MSRIVEDWIMQLGGGSTAMLDLADIIGVHKTTLWRWGQPEDGEKSMRPNLERIRRYDAQVLRAAADRAGASERAGS